MDKSGGLRIAMNGVTGRMGCRQHLERSILAIREEGGLLTPDGRRVQVEPVLVGRDEGRLAELAGRHDVAHWTTDLDSVLADPTIDVYFDAQVTSARVPALRRAIAAGKNIYTEKPTASTVAEAVELAGLAAGAGITAGVVHDKLFLPGLLQLRSLVSAGFFGRLLSLRGEFGYWVFEGSDPDRPAQRPSWNYRAEDGGGITLDMLCHWNYVLEAIIGPVRSVTAQVVTHVPRRWDEDGVEYAATADDAVYALFELDGGVVAQINSSWAVRVHRDELVEFQLDGTEGSAVAGLRRCTYQALAATPRPVWNPDLAETDSFRSQWTEVPSDPGVDNAFKVQWEEFLRDALAGRPHRYDLVSAARGVQLAQLCMQASAEGRRILIPEIIL